MGARQYHFHTGDMFVIPDGYSNPPCRYDIISITQSLPEDRYQVFTVTVVAGAGGGKFKVHTRTTSRLALLHYVKRAYSGKEFEDFKLRFLIECGTTLESKFKEGVDRLKKYPYRYRTKPDPNAVVTDPSRMKSKSELRRKK